MSGLQVATHFTHIKLDIIVNFYKQCKVAFFLDILVIQYIMVMLPPKKQLMNVRKNFFIDRKKLVIYIISLRKCLFLIDIFLMLKEKMFIIN